MIKTSNRGLDFVKNEGGKYCDSDGANSEIQLEVSRPAKLKSALKAGTSGLGPEVLRTKSGVEISLSSDLW